MMRKSAGIGLLGAVTCLIVPSAALAANREAQDMVAGLARDQARLLARFPALAQIDGFIRSDCAAKNNGKLAADAFCRCASAVTMGLWRSGADPKMVPRLKEYLKNPTETAAAAFLHYQGPELYRPICTEATNR